MEKPSKNVDKRRKINGRQQWNFCCGAASKDDEAPLVAYKCQGLGNTENGASVKNAECG